MIHGTSPRADSTKTAVAPAASAKSAASLAVGDTSTTGGGTPSGLDLKGFAKRGKNGDGDLTGNEIKKNLKSADRNGDGVVSKEEYALDRGRAKAEKTLKSRDKNGDGVLTGKEISKKVAGADENGDGIITQGELRRANNDKIGFADRFKAFDQNGDGVLTGKEVANEKWAKGLDVDGDGKVTAEEFVKVRSEGRLKAQLKDYDQNGDGFLSGKDIQANVLKMKDQDGDGRLSLDEWLGIKKTEPAPVPPPPPTAPPTPTERTDGKAPDAPAAAPATPGATPPESAEPSSPGMAPAPETSTEVTPAVLPPTEQNTPAQADKPL